MALLVVRGGLSDPVTAERLEALGELLRGYSIQVIHEDDELFERAREVETCFGKVTEEFVFAAENLRWLQWDAAGVNQVVGAVRQVVESGRTLVFTNASGIHGTIVAEHLLALMFCFSRQLHYAFELQQIGGWRDGKGPKVFHLEGKRVLLIGLGAIGSAFARKARALGMNVIGVRRRADLPHDDIDSIVPVEELAEELPSADFVVITTPLTDRTRNLIGAEELARMKSSAYLLNVGRGGIVDESALRDALTAGREGGGIAGAGFDVFVREPLPTDDPIRCAPNILITPHYGGWTRDYDERLWNMFLENARRYSEGQPLLSVVDPQEGY